MTPDQLIRLKRGAVHHASAVNSGIPGWDDTLMRNQLAGYVQGFFDGADINPSPEENLQSRAIIDNAASLYP